MSGILIFLCGRRAGRRHVRIAGQLYVVSQGFRATREQFGSALPRGEVLQPVHKNALLHLRVLRGFNKVGGFLPGLSRGLVELRGVGIERSAFRSRLSPARPSLLERGAVLRDFSVQRAKLLLDGITFWKQRKVMPGEIEPRGDRAYLADPSLRRFLRLLAGIRKAARLAGAVRKLLGEISIRFRKLVGGLGAIFGALQLQLGLINAGARTRGGIARGINLRGPQRTVCLALPIRRRDGRDTALRGIIRSRGGSAGGAVYRLVFRR